MRVSVCPFVLWIFRKRKILLRDDVFLYDRLSRVKPNLIRSKESKVQN
jgi:hypothetical protein